MAAVSAILMVTPLVLLVVGLWGLVFWRGRRRRALWYPLAAVLLAVISVAVAPMPEKPAAGGQAVASAAAPETANQPPSVSTQPANQPEVTEQTPAELQELIDLVETAAGGLPDRFEDRGPQVVRFENMLRPLPDDVMAYAKFFWVVDEIEIGCPHLGQRDNIEMLAPSNGVHTWSLMPISTGIAALDGKPHHNHTDYLAVRAVVLNAIANAGEDTVCAEMYRRLGPSGSLMSHLATDVSNLLDPTTLDRWEVKPEDGVLWSSRDYCEREYYLRAPADQAMHDMICAKAKEQPF
jgi:guanyl-specific ribonuclease Sa